MCTHVYISHLTKNKNDVIIVSRTRVHDIKRGERMAKNTYIAIDLKSFYASVECVERKLDPLTTNLVVADASRTDKTICLAVSPSMKSHGIPGRPRLFEVIAKVNQVNNQRRWNAPKRKLLGSTFNNNILKEDKTLALDYIVAPPQMDIDAAMR